MKCMKCIIGNIIFNQCSGKEWLLSESIMDLVWIYTYCSGDDADAGVSKQIYAMVEDRGNLQAVEKIRRNLLDVHCKMCHQVKDKPTNVLASLMNIPAPKKYHYWFALLLDPWYAMELKYIKTFHQSENVENKKVPEDDAQVI